MSSPEKIEGKPLDKIYLEASQWVRLANTIIWSMGTLLVPISFGFVGLALNRASSVQFTSWGKVFLGVGSVFLFSFWVYASRIYKLSSNISRKVLMKIEKEKWELEKDISLYSLQASLVDRRFKFFPLQFGLFSLQLATLGALVLVWVLILCFDL